MTRGLTGRIERLDAHLGWRRMTFRHESGRTLYVSSGLLIDAFLRQVGGQSLDLPPHIALFISDAVVGVRASDLHVSVVSACREQFNPPTRTVTRSDDDPPFELPDH